MCEIFYTKQPTVLLNMEMSKLTNLRFSADTIVSFQKWIKRIKIKTLLTSLAGPAQVARPGAVTHVAVPALSADAVVLTRVAQALLGQLLGA